MRPPLPSSRKKFCEHLGVTPREFFDGEDAEPQLVSRLCELARHMSESDLKILVGTAERLRENKLSATSPRENLSVNIAKKRGSGGRIVSQIFFYLHLTFRRFNVIMNS